MKVCSKCKKTKPISAFHKNKNMLSGLASSCSLCCSSSRNRDVDKNADLVRRYGITLAIFNEMKQKQQGCCAICDRSGIQLCVDHDHATGKVRGLLCHRCNKSIGLFEDDTALLTQAQEYLDTYK